MKLLTKSEIKNSVRKENEQLLNDNIRLKKINQNLLKLDFPAEKVKMMREFQQFSSDINEKKSFMFQELKKIETLIEQKKEILYGLIEKQDEIMEREAVLKEREAKVELREKFVEEIDSKQKTK